MKLTNKDIAENYRDKKYLLMRSDLLGAFVYWIIIQSPYDTPDITEALIAFNKYISKRFKDNIPEIFTYDELGKFINEDIFEAIPEIEKLNHPKIERVSYNEPHNPDHDFIDLSALARNIFFMLLREYITEGS